MHAVASMLLADFYNKEAAHSALDTNSPLELKQPRSRKTSTITHHGNRTVHFQLSCLIQGVQSSAQISMSPP